MSGRRITASPRRALHPEESRGIALSRASSRRPRRSGQNPANAIAAAPIASQAPTHTGRNQGVSRNGARIMPTCVLIVEEKRTAEGQHRAEADQSEAMVPLSWPRFVDRLGNHFLGSATPSFSVRSCEAAPAADGSAAAKGWSPCRRAPCSAAGSGESEVSRTTEATVTVAIMSNIRPHLARRATFKAVRRSSSSSAGSGRWRQTSPSRSRSRSLIAPAPASSSAPPSRGKSKRQGIWRNVQHLPISA